MTTVSSTEDPYISLIIPSLNGFVEEMEASLHIQSWVPDSIKIVRGIRPNGRARNAGVALTYAQSQPDPEQVHYLVFIDDDAKPGNERLIEGLVRPLIDDPSIGVTGTARVLPQNATWFQRRIAKEIPRTVNKIPDSPLETNPPLNGYGHSLITTTCCAIRYSVYHEVGGFSEKLTSGVDTDFFYRVRELGYRFILVPGTYVIHPAPNTIKDLVGKYYWYGIGYGQEAQIRPSQKMGPRLPSRIHRAIFLLAATLWLIPNIFLLYSLSYPEFTIGFRPLKALSTYAVAWGYINGWGRGAA